MTKPIKVLVWHWGRRGGGVQHTLHLGRELIKNKDLDVTFSLSKQSDVFEETCALDEGPGFHIDTYTSTLGFLGKAFALPLLKMRWANYLESEKFDVVLCTMSHLWNFFMVSSISASGARYVLTLHDGMLHPGEDYYFRRKSFEHEMAHVDHVVTLSNHVRDVVCKHHKFPLNRTSVIPLGSFGEEEPFPKKYPREGDLKLLFLGRIVKYKGLHFLLEAYRKLREEKARVSLTIAGSGDIEEYAEQFRGLEGITLEHRWLDDSDFPRFCRAADVLVCPYVEASQSGVVPGALQAGLPSVVTPAGGLKEQVSHMKTGYVCEDISSESVYKGIRFLLDNPSEYEKMSIAALAYVKDELSWATLAEKHSGVMKQVVRPEL